MYHLELRQFPHVARAFNLDREAVDTRFLRPWVDGEMIDYGERRWPPDKTRLVVLEGPEVETTDIGMGRGWGRLTRRAQDVTERVLAEIHRGADARPEVEAMKDAIAEIGATPLAFADVMAMAGVAQPLWRASEQLGLAEQAVWEMLHQARLKMVRGEQEIGREDWQSVVLSWAAWTGESEPPVRLTNT